MKDKRKSFVRFNERDKKLEEQYGPSYKERQHKKGKLTARERIQLLFDKDTFEELDTFVRSSTTPTDVYGDGVIVGYGQINGRKAFVYAQDFNFMGGSLGVAHAAKIMKVQDMARKMGHPIIGLIDSGGARIQEGIASLSGYGGIFLRNIQSSGIIPQISVILGPAAGGAVYSPAITDFIFMTRHVSRMFVTGPQVVKEVLNEDVTFDQLGGADVHARKSGVAQFVYDDEEHTLIGVRKLLQYLPSNNIELPPILEKEVNAPSKPERLRLMVPEESTAPYDMIDIIDNLVDKDSFFEVAESFAMNMLTGFARLDGKVIGIVANQPKVLAGVLDVNSSVKSARFVRFCDAFNIPLLVLEDVPGFLPGTEQEHAGLIRHGAKLLFAFGEASVPKITVITRKAYGGAYIVMNSRNMGGDFNFAWPSAEVAVMGPEGAIKILKRKELAESEDPEKLKKQFVFEYQENTANPYVADEYGFIDEVIDPAVTRRKLISAFDLLQNKYLEKSPRKHGNMPL